MSYDTENCRNDYTGNGSVSEFDFTFKIFTKQDLRVVVRTDLDVELADLEVDVDFSVAGVGRETGGSITLLAGALADGYSITIIRDVPFNQTTSIKNQREFYPEIHEKTFDRLVMQIQQLREMLQRSVRLPVTSSGDVFNMELPTFLGANRTVVTGPDGLSFVTGPTPEELSNAGAAADAAIDAAADAAISAAAAASSAMASASSAAASAASATTAASYASAAAASAAEAENAADLAASYVLIHGAADPDVGTGVDYQVYLNTSSGEFFEKQDGSWISIFQAVGGDGGAQTGRDYLNSGDRALSIVLDPPMEVPDYFINFSVVNTEDSVDDLAFLIGAVTSQDENGFTITFNTVAPSDFYGINWTAKL